MSKGGHVSCRGKERQQVVARREIWEELCFGFIRMETLGIVQGCCEGEKGLERERKVKKRERSRKKKIAKLRQVGM